MKLLQRLVQDLRAGWITLRQGTAEAATRALEESEIVRLRLRLRKLDEQIDHLYEEIGERAVARFEKGEAMGQFAQDSDVAQSLAQLQDVRLEREKVVADIDDVRRGT